MDSTAVPAPAAPRLTRLPIVVGVAGHRDLVFEPSDPSLEAPGKAIERHLSKLLDTYPNTPLIVLSGLAEGADALAAKVTFDLAARPAYRDPSGGPRITFVAALPMPLHVCATDFEAPDHRAWVTSLVAPVDGGTASLVKTIAVWEPGDVRVDALSETDRREVLDRHYARLGAYISRNCHLLIALWNGYSPRPGTTGGTADVVAWFKAGAPSVHLAADPMPNPLRVPDGLRCIRIPCERASESGSVSLDLAAADQERKDAHEILVRIDEFNRRASAFDGANLPESEVSTSFDGNDAPGRSCVAGYLDVQRVADALARTFKSSRQSVRGWIVVLAFVAIASFEMFAHGPQIIGDRYLRASLLLAYVVAFGSSIVLVDRIRKRRTEENSFVYRSLAEALRVQCLWRGVHARDRADDAYDVLHQDSIAWVRQGLKGLHVVADGDPAPTLPPLPALSWARASWVEGQHIWFRKEVSKLHERLRRATSQARTLVLVGLGLALLYVAMVATGKGFAHHDHDLHGGVVMLLVVIVAAGGLRRAWAAGMAYEATIERYRAAEELFKRAREALDAAIAANDPVAGRIVLRALGREALAENVGWVQLHLDHRLEPVDP